MKICLYKSFILPVLLYAVETRTSSSDEQALGVVENKIYLRFMDLSAMDMHDNMYDDVDVVKRIKIRL